MSFKKSNWSLGLLIVLCKTFNDFLCPSLACHEYSSLGEPLAQSWLPADKEWKELAGCGPRYASNSHRRDVNSLKAAEHSNTVYTFEWLCVWNMKNQTGLTGKDGVGTGLGTGLGLLDLGIRGASCAPYMARTRQAFEMASQDSRSITCARSWYDFHFADEALE
jgi:hypothetical protein